MFKEFLGNSGFKEYLGNSGFKEYLENSLLEFTASCNNMKRLDATFQREKSLFRIEQHFN